MPANKNKITDYKKYITDNTKVDSNNCWIWQKGKDKGGYGIARSNIRRGNEGAHRISFRIFKGPIRQNLFVCHTCDVPACCNPLHLKLGTPQDNSDDMVLRSSKHLEGIVKLKEQILKRNGYVKTPFGKFKTLTEAGFAIGKSNGFINRRIKSCKYPGYYRIKK